MDNNIIVLYENRKLIIQTSSIISKGQLKVVDRDNPENTLFTHDILDTDFLRVAAELPNGKLQLQLITPQETLVKNINIKQ